MAVNKSRWTPLHTLAVIVIAALIVVIGVTAHSWDYLFGLTGLSSGRLWAWLLTMILLLAFAATTGHGITGLWAGVLIDDRNRMSLSRLQMVLWTILVLAAFLTAALSNVVLDPLGSPLAIGIPGELLLAMGISITSLIGTPLILNSKSATPNAEEQAQTVSILESRGVAPGTLGNEGLIVTKSTPQDAQVADLFRGEETGNAAQLDLGKVQMFYVTLVLVLAYALAIGATFASAPGLISMLPRIDPSFVALLGLSHAGYLTYKAFPHSKTQSDTVALSPSLQAQIMAGATAPRAVPDPALATVGAQVDGATGAGQ
jgi:hypothetical protein